MRDATFVVDKIDNPHLKNPEIREKLEAIGAIDGRGNRSLDYIVVTGDVVTGRLLVGRRNKSGREFVQDVSWPHKIQLPIDGAGVDEGGADLLFGLVSAIRPCVVFETGTHKGRSAKAIASALVKNGALGHLWTVDMDDYGVIPAVFTTEEADRVTSIVGKTPEILASDELQALKNIEFAHLDGAHDATIIAELDFVEAHAAADCLVIIDNVLDDSFSDFIEVLGKYTKHPKVTLQTMCGTMLVSMHRDAE